MVQPKIVNYEVAGGQGLNEGTPTGEVVFIAIPEPTFIALSDAASKRGTNVAALLAQAIGVVLKS